MFPNTMSVPVSVVGAVVMTTDHLVQAVVDADIDARLKVRGQLRFVAG